METIISIPNDNPYPREKTLITNIRARKAKGLQSYEVYWLIPDTDDEAMDQYNCDLKELIAQGVRSFSTHPNYQLEFVDDELTPEAHNRCQDLANNFKLKTRKYGETKKFNELFKKAKEKFTLEELEQLII